MTNHDARGGNVTDTAASTVGNGSDLRPGSVPAAVTIPRSAVPTGTEPTTGGHVTAGTGTPGVPVPAVTAPVTNGGRWSIFGRERGNGNGNGNGAHAPVTVPDEPASGADETGSAVTGPAPKGGAKHAGKTTREANWRLIAMWAAIIVMTAMTTVLAASGQIDGTWTWAGLDSADKRRYLLPGATEVAVIGFLLIGQYALSKGQSPFLWWRVAALFAVAAILMNSIHGEEGYRIQQGLIFGLASAASLAMWFAKFWIDYLDYRKREGHIAGLRPKVWNLGSLRHLPLTWRADLIVARCEQVTTRAEAYRLAELWRMVKQDVKAQGKGRKIAGRTAWYTVYRELGVKVIAPKKLEIAEVTFAEPEPEPVVRPPVAPAAPVASAAMSRLIADTVTPPATRRPTPAPAAVNPDEVEKEIDPKLYEVHAERIAALQAAHPDWIDNKKVTSVNAIQKGVEGVCAPIPGCGNRDVATEVAACIRNLRAQALVARRTS